MSTTMNFSDFNLLGEIDDYLSKDCMHDVSSGSEETEQPEVSLSSLAAASSKVQSAAPFSPSFPSTRIISTDCVPSIEGGISNEAILNDVSPEDDSLKHLLDFKHKQIELHIPTVFQTIDVKETPIIESTKSGKPSSFPRQELCGSNITHKVSLPEIQPIKRRKVSVLKKEAISETALHEACLNGQEATIMSLIQQDANLASQPRVVSRPKQVYNLRTARVETRFVTEKYTYPLTLAIQAQVSNPVIEALVQAAPQVLLAIDGGAAQQSTMHILMQHMPHNADVVNMILLKQPTTTKALDCKHNTPLHVACRQGAALDVVRHLCILYPGALQHKNFHGLTPLQLAQHQTSGGCSDEVTSYLWEEQDRLVAKLDYYD